MTWWRRLHRRRRVILLASPLILLAWLVLPGIWWPLALLFTICTNLFLDIREDRNYLREARARDLTEGEPR